MNKPTNKTANPAAAKPTRAEARPRTARKAKASHAPRAVDEDPGDAAVEAADPLKITEVAAAAPAGLKPANGSKTETVIAMLCRQQGASVDELMNATGWQRHSVRGALAGAVKKKLGAAVTSAMAEGVRRYHASVAGGVR